jgi:cold shock protein
MSDHHRRVSTQGNRSARDMARLLIAELYIALLQLKELPPFLVIRKNIRFLVVRKLSGWNKALALVLADGGGTDAFVHNSAVERAGMSTLNEGQKVSFDLVNDPKKGKTSAENLKPVT